MSYTLGHGIGEKKKKKQKKKKKPTKVDMNVRVKKYLLIKSDFVIITATFSKLAKFHPRD